MTNGKIETGSMNGYVYFLRSPTAVKIGFSKRPAARFNQLRSGEHQPMEFVGCFEGTKDDEIVAQHIAGIPIHGTDWFSPDTPIDRIVGYRRLFSLKDVDGVFNLQIRIPPALKRELISLAAELGCYPRDLVTEALEHFLPVKRQEAIERERGLTKMLGLTNQAVPVEGEPGTESRQNLEVLHAE